MKRGVAATIFILLLAVIAGGGVLSPVKSTKPVVTGIVGQTGTNATAADLITQGKSQLTAHNILGARNLFQQAVTADGTNQEAQLLYGVTRVFAVAEDGQSLNTTGLDSVREIFTLAGFGFSQFSIYGSTYTTPHQFASTTPRTGAVLDFLKAKLLPEVDGAIANLAAVNNSSFTSVIDPSSISKGPGVAITVDYADALVIRALLQAMKCNLELLMVYGLDASLPDIQAGHKQMMTYKQLFSDTTFLTPKDAPRLATAKTALVAFIDTYSSAAQYLKNRSGSGHHLFVIDVPMTDEAASLTTLRLDKIRDELAELKAALNGGTYLLPIKRMNDQDRFIDLSKFFNSITPINFRSQLANCTNGTVLADPTLGGLFPLGLTAAFSSKLPAIARDIAGVACTGWETPMIKLNPGGMYLNYSYSSTQTLTISNLGTSNLSVSSVDLVGQDWSEFVLSSGTCGSLSPTLSPGGSCTEVVSLKTPYNIMNPRTEIRISSTDLSSPYSFVDLYGYTSGPNPSQSPSGNFLAAINIAGSGSGNVEFSGHSPDYYYSYSGTCPGICSGQVVTGTILYQHPLPSPGSFFAGWSGCDAVSGDTCNVSMFSAKTVTATFNKDTRTPVVTAYPPSGTYYGPQSVTLAANKDAAIYYTLNGTTPSASSTRYTGPFSLSAPTTTLKYIAIDPFSTASAVKTETYGWHANPTLTVSANGSGGGTINNIKPYSGLIICSKPAQNGDKCSATLLNETVVTLTASPDSTSLFSGWSLSSCQGTGNCTITLDTNTSVTGTFAAMPPVKVETPGYPTTYHTTLQEAFANAHANSVIWLQAVTFDATNLLFNQPFSIAIMGGYDAGFETPSLYSTLQGILTIGSGSATVDRLIVK